MRLGAFPVICAQDLVFRLSALRQHLPWGVTVYKPHWRAVEGKKRRRGGREKKNLYVILMLSERGSVDWIQTFTQQRNNIWWFMQRRVVTREGQRRTFFYYYHILLFYPISLAQSYTKCSESKLKLSLVHHMQWRHEWTRFLNPGSDSDPPLSAPRPGAHPLIRHGLKVLAATGFHHHLHGLCLYAHQARLEFAMTSSSSPSVNSTPRLCNLEFSLKLFAIFLFLCSAEVNVSLALSPPNITPVGMTKYTG